MRNRFGSKRSGGVLRMVLLPVCFFTAILCFFYFTLENMTASTQSEQLNSTQQAVRRAVVLCYAVEGSYPQSIAYLQEHYGLQVDTGKFIIHYEPVAANLSPVIEVFPAAELTRPGGPDNQALDQDWSDLPEPNEDAASGAPSVLEGADMQGLLEEDAV